MNRFYIALWCSWSLEGVGLLLGASEGASLWLPCTPLCCWLGRPHLLGNKSEAKKSNLGANQVKGSSRNCAHGRRCNKGDCWGKKSMRKGQTRMLPSPHSSSPGHERNRETTESYRNKHSTISEQPVGSTTPERPTASGSGVPLMGTLTLPSLLP